jgi:hypothetical protein
MLSFQPPHVGCYGLSSQGNRLACNIAGDYLFAHAERRPLTFAAFHNQPSLLAQ